MRFVVLVTCLLALSACYQVQLKGPVAGATVIIAERGADESLVTVDSWDQGYLLELFGADTWNELDPFGRLLLLGVFVADKKQFDAGKYYQLTAIGGFDMDVDQDLVTDAAGAAIPAEIHALASAQHLRVAGVQVSALTEAVYQYLAPALGNLRDIDLGLQLDLLAQRVVADINADGVVDYADLLQWSQLLHQDALLADAAVLGAFTDAVLAGADSFTLGLLAQELFESGAARSGEMVYRFTRPQGNSFTCASCHALTEPAANGLRRPGHPLLGATRRPHWKDGQLDSMLAAANSCLDEWMNADPWTTSSADWLALSSWLDEAAPAGDAAPVDIQIAALPAVLAGGNAAAGRHTFNDSCAICHGQEGAGSNQAPPVAGFGLSPELVANRVRLSGRADSAVYEGLSGGVMPFWGANRLSDAELLDIVAWLAEGEDGGTGGGGGGGGGSACSSDNPRVGQSTTLTTRAHGVTGTATIVDDCTIELTGFNFDGRGIVVQAYTGVDGNFFGPGVHAIGPDLVGPRFTDATLQFTLPSGVSLDDFNSFSIWCVTVGVSFGDGIFR